MVTTGQDCNAKRLITPQSKLSADIRNLLLPHSSFPSETHEHPQSEPPNTDVTTRSHSHYWRLPRLTAQADEEAFCSCLTPKSTTAPENMSL